MGYYQPPYPPRRGNPLLGVTILLIVIILLAGGIGFYLWGGGVMAKVVAEDSQEVIIIYKDIEEIPDEVNATETPTDEELEEEGLLDDEEEPDSEDPQPELDHSFSGTVKTTAQFLDSEANILSILPLQFFKYEGSPAIDKFRIILNWDFKLGEDLDQESLDFHFWSTMKTKYQDMDLQTSSGFLYAGEILEGNIKDHKGSTQIWFDVEDPKLRWRDIRDYGGQRYRLTTTTDTFKFYWEATVQTKGGVGKRISGTLGIELVFMYDEGAYSGYFDNGHYVDPNPPLISIIPLGRPN
jgi:hypothetical protein